MGLVCIYLLAHAQRAAAGHYARLITRSYVCAVESVLRSMYDMCAFMRTLGMVCAHCECATSPDRRGG